MDLRSEKIWREAWCAVPRRCRAAACTSKLDKAHVNALSLTVRIAVWAEMLCSNLQIHVCPTALCSGGACSCAHPHNHNIFRKPHTHNHKIFQTTHHTTEKLTHTTKISSQKLTHRIPISGEQLTCTTRIFCRWSCTRGHCQGARGGPVAQPWLSPSCGGTTWQEIAPHRHHVPMYLYMNVWMRVCMCVCMYIYICICTYMHSHHAIEQHGKKLSTSSSRSCVCVCVYMYVFVYVCMYAITNMRWNRIARNCST